MNPVALLVLQVSVAVKFPVQFPPQVECFLALSCSRRTCTDEFPMISAKEFSVYCPQCEVALTPPPLSYGEALRPHRCCSAAWPPPRTSSRRPSDFAPPPYDRFALLAITHGCAWLQAYSQRLL